MRLRFLWIGETKDPLFSGIEESYLKRIGRFVSVDRSFVAEEKKQDRRSVAAQLEKEKRRLEKRLVRPTYLVVLDQRGQTVNSRGLADKMNFFLNSSIPEVTFLVGGHIGIPEEVVTRADWKLSLGKLTLTHEMARVVLLEQIYRGFSILHGLPYHR